MIALNDFGFVVRELLNEPVLIMAGNGNLELDPSVEQSAIAPRGGLEKSLLPPGARGVTSAIEPFDGEVIGVEARNAAVCEMVNGAAPIAVALPFVSAAEMEMCELNFLSEKRIGECAGNWTGGIAGFPGNMSGDEGGEFGG